MYKTLLLPLLTLALRLVHAQEEEKISWPEPHPGNYTISNFNFDQGRQLDKLVLAYQTIGELKIEDDGTTNAVLLLHGSDAESGQFLVDSFAGTLFNPGQVLDAEKYFLIMRDGIGHGLSSNPRNTGLHASFPSYQYSDMIRADHRLLTEHFGINHARLIMGVSMGGMHSWMWGEEYPDFMDALMPIASQPVQIGGHNRMWRRLMMEVIQRDPNWEGGDYKKQPMGSLLGALSILQTMLQGPLSMAEEYPTRDAADAFVDGLLDLLAENPNAFDVNSLLYAYNASYTYDPESRLKSIKAPLTAVNTDDDLMNPPQLGTIERAVQDQMVEGLGRAVVVPTSNETFGHGSYIDANLWKAELMQLLERSKCPGEGM
ncbi:uncharacterized protein LTR77_010305 [Saxophila tyrrhenica]|uniref:AB hydrolase-1 domain-containing protein n=1 Tax=Saxophila tyrrhenica TaxID=1690608 RepID=A0AAV9NWP5_9PEZI|nr:hypothetical protein LTR77_010305 [Saxophila tyrrhenica]